MDKLMGGDRPRLGMTILVRIGDGTYECRSDSPDDPATSAPEQTHLPKNFLVHHCITP
ncbi:hypothetical protein RMSM_06241 [Rhodopirellula maiorica SM1]|uniref:Uncharacterized protein n=1 Tax=Rhodopirellula maiorica SM1 TaxID=1265738 RepID=M5RCR6_9BACT|nr:hypothetical protein RMSM_06241 [Rhodopirellula maiorica SM1]